MLYKIVIMFLVDLKVDTGNQVIATRTVWRIYYHNI